MQEEQLTPEQIASMSEVVAKYMGWIIIFIFIFLFTLLLKELFFAKENKCSKGGYHDWIYKESLESIKKTDWKFNILMGINNHNLLPYNRRYICKKCNKTEKL